MKVLMKARAKFYAVWDDVQHAWTFQKDGANCYRYPLNTFDYGSKIVEYFKLDEFARMYKADGMRDTGAEVSVSLHKDDDDEGEPIYEKYTGTDSEVIIWVDYFDNEGRGVEEGDYIEVDVLGFDDAVGLAIMNSLVTPEPTPPTPTVNFEIVEGTRNLTPGFFDAKPECPAGMVLYPCSNEDNEEGGFIGLYVMVNDGGWRPDYKLNTIYDGMTVSNILAAMEEGDGETSYNYAWVAITPPANSGNSGSDDEEDEGGSEEE